MVDQHDTEDSYTATSSVSPTPSDNDTISTASTVPGLVQQLFEGRAELGPDVLKDPKFNTLLTPFDLQWIHGFNIKVPIINLSVKNYREIFYTASHMGVIYDFCNKEMVILKGHQHKIISVSIDKKFRWLATADDGEEGCILVWDAVFHKLVSTIFNPTHYGKILLIAITPSAKNLIVICENDEEMTINVWLWSCGKDIPDDTYSYGECGKLVPKSIQFHPNDEQHLMIIFDKEVAFFNLDTSNGKLNNLSKRHVSPHKFGSVTSGTYLEFVHECYLATTKGNILLYGTTLYKKPWNEGKFDNNKSYTNCIKISKIAITCMTTVDSLLAACDEQGKIQFFTKNLGLLYWIKPPEPKPVIHMSFHRDPRNYKIETKALKQISQASIGSSFYDTACCRDQDRSEEYEILMKNDVPLDVSLNHLPFVTRDLVVSTTEGLYGVDVLNRKYMHLFAIINSQVAALEVHAEYPYLLIALENGRLSLYNYESKEEITTSVLDPPKEGQAKISTIRYSPICLHLACGRDNGELWFIQPVILTPKQTFHVTNRKVIKMEFSSDNLQMFYYDADNTVCGFFYHAEDNQWLYKGKVRSHYKEIKHLLYSTEDPCGFFTIGEDRNMVYYIDLELDSENMTIQKRDRIEQRDIPLYFMLHPKKKMSKSSQYLIADNKHKFKLINTKTCMCISVNLGPAYGCWKDSPVSKMEFLPYSDKKYMVFMNKRNIGLQLMPADGNPFKFLGCLADPTELVDFRISADGTHLFTFGKNSRCVLMWKVCCSGVEILHNLGGDELDAFYCLLEGGKNGIFFQEMQDLFYFKQILHQGEHTVWPRVITNVMEIIELPDLVRACGYYPTEYEIENMITDIRYRDYDENLKLREKISYCDFVKLFINHKPAYGYKIEELQEAFDMITSFVDGSPTGEIERYDFVDAVISTGESFGKDQLQKCLTTLMVPADETSEQSGEEFDFLPETIDFDALLHDILGIDLNDSNSLLNVTEESEDDADVCY